MADGAFGLSPRISLALDARPHAEPAAVHRLQVGLAGLVSAQASPAAPEQLALASAFIEGRAQPEALLDAQQDCWAYVGSLACGCSLADSASAHAILTCLDTRAEAHSAAALREQVERVLRCGASEAAVLAILEAG